MAARAGLGLRLSRSKSVNAIQRVQPRAADPTRVRHTRLPRARDWRDAAARLDRSRAACGRNPRSCVGEVLRADFRIGDGHGGAAERSPIPHHPALSVARLRCAGAAPARIGGVAMMRDLAFQFVQMLLVLALSPLLTGLVRKVKARLTRRKGPPLLQPYRDLVRLMRKDVVLAESSSWLFRVIPYAVFAGTWVAASLIPTFRTGLLFSWTADLIAIVALLGSARFFLALAGMDVGTSFGGIGTSREMMIASLAEPAMLMIVFTLALIAGSTQLSAMSAFMASPSVGLRVSLGMAVAALIMVALA